MQRFIRHNIVANSQWLTRVERILSFCLLSSAFCLSWSQLTYGLNMEMDHSLEESEEFLLYSVQFGS